MQSSQREHRRVKVGIAQMACTADKEANIARYTEKVRELAAQGAQIVCLQELFASLYFCDEEHYQNFQLAEAIPDGPTCQHFMQLAKELGIVMVCSLFEKRAEGLYHNTTAVIDADGTYLGKYRKMHIPDDPGYYEKFYFTPGDLGYKVFRTKYATLGVLICWDQWYPEAARITSLMGAELLFFPTAIGWDVRQSEEDNREQYEAWQTIQRSHAVAGKAACSSGAAASSPTPSDVSCTKPPISMRLSTWRNLTSTRPTTTAVTGPTIATAA